MMGRRHSHSCALTCIMRGTWLNQHVVPSTWACSSAGRAPRSQRGGQRFDPAQVHHLFNYLREPVSLTPRFCVVVCVVTPRQTLQIDRIRPPSRDAVESCALRLNPNVRVVLEHFGGDMSG